MQAVNELLEIRQELRVTQVVWFWNRPEQVVFIYIYISLYTYACIGTEVI